MVLKATKDNQNEKRAAEATRLGYWVTRGPPPASTVFRQRVQKRYRLQITICALIVRHLPIT